MKKKMYLILSLVGLVVVVLLIQTLTGCSKIYKVFGISDDNPVEEFVEKQIEINTGLDVDFTPYSIERRK